MNGFKPGATITCATQNGTAIDRNARMDSGAKADLGTVLGAAGPTNSSDTVSMAASITDVINELDRLRKERIELMNSLAVALAGNEIMGRVIDADDRLRAAFDEVMRQKAIAESAEHRLGAISSLMADRVRSITYWKSRAQKLEKSLKGAI